MSRLSLHLQLLHLMIGLPDTNTCLYQPFFVGSDKQQRIYNDLSGFSFACRSVRAIGFHGDLLVRNDCVHFGNTSGCRHLPCQYTTLDKIQYSQLAWVRCLCIDSDRLPCGYPQLLLYGGLSIFTGRY